MVWHNRVPNQATGEAPQNTVAPGPPVENTLYPLDFKPELVAFSPSLDVVIASEFQSTKLRIINPNTGTVEEVQLMFSVDGIAVTPDGLLAAINHGQHVSLVNLSSKTLEPIIDHGGAVAAAGEWVYILPRSEFSAAILSVNRRTGDVFKGDEAITGALRMHPSGQWVYAYRPNALPHVARFETLAGPIAKTREDRHTLAADPFCWPFWFSERGDFAFTACGAVFKVSQDPNRDLKTAESLPGSTDRRTIHSLSHSEAARRLVVAAVSESTPEVADELTTYKFPGFELVARDGVLPLGTAAMAVRPNIHWVFTSHDGRRVYAVMLPTVEGVGPPAGVYLSALR